MKKTFKFIAAIGFISSLFFSSCSKVQDVASDVKVQPVKALYATLDDSKTVLSGDLKPKFYKDDMLLVGGKDGDGNYDKYRFDAASSEYADPDNLTPWPATTAKFVTGSWAEGLTPVYAACSYGFSYVEFTETTITTMIGTNNVQAITNHGSYANRAASHLGKFDNDGSLATMKNVNALLGFKLTNSDITSVKIESVGGEALTGYITVDYAKFINGDADFFTDLAKHVNDKITVESAFKDGEDNTLPFTADEMIYVSLIPRTYASGLKFTLTKTDGSYAERIVSSSLTFSAGQLRNIPTALDNGLTFLTEEEGTLPDEFTMDLNFADNPFREALTAKADQTAEGETYTYRLDLGTVGATHYYKDIPVGLFKSVNDNRYAIASGYLGYDRYTDRNTLGGIALPAIPGYFLKAITVSTPMSAYSITITNAMVDGYDSMRAACVKDGDIPANAVDHTAVTFDTSSGTVAGGQYYLYQKLASATAYNKQFRISDLKLTYSKSLPAPVLEDIVMTMTNSSYKMADGTDLPTRTSYSDPEKEFYHTDYPDYKFAGVAAKWSTTHLSVKGGSCLKLPRIAGYKLTKIVFTDFKPSATRNAKITDSAGTYADLTPVAGGDQIGCINTKSAAEMTWNLTDTYSADKDYYIAANGELGIKWTLTYTPVENL